MTDLRIALVEDEEIVARRLQRLLGRVLGDRRTSITRLTNLHDALDYLADHPIDLLFLDLDLGGEDGFRLLGEAVAASFHTIIVSARHDQALRAFEYGVVDFVAKPYTEDRLRQAIERVTHREGHCGIVSATWRSAAREKFAWYRWPSCSTCGQPTTTPSSTSKMEAPISTARP